MNQRIVLNANQTSELEERILRAQSIHRLTDWECGFLANLLLGVEKGAEAQISEKQLVCLADIEDKGQFRILELERNRYPYEDTGGRPYWTRRAEQAASATVVRIDFVSSKHSFAVVRRRGACL